MSGIHRIACLAVFAASVALAAAADPPPGREALWAAVRSGDPKAVAAALDAGADVNARNEYGVTALWIAASKGKPAVVGLLLDRGADPNARDGIWYETPLSLAVGSDHDEAVKLLLKAGAKDVDAAVIRAARGKPSTLRAVLDNARPSQNALDAALFTAPKDGAEVREALTKAGAVPPKPVAAKDRDAWMPLAGTYESENGGRLVIELRDPGLVAVRGGALLLIPTGPDTFSPLGLDAVSYTFERKAGAVDRVVLRQYTAEVRYYRLEAKPDPKPVNPPKDNGGGLVAGPLNWPMFRGPDATGIADGQSPPLTWDVPAGTNVRWKTPISGLGHSCPVVWGERVFVTTAVSGDPDPKVRTGNYGDVGSVNDTSPHSWQVLCLERDSGKILWAKTSCEGVPKIKRHLKGSQANCTPATDGRRVVACFGPEGLYCYDFDGKLLWKRDLGAIDSSFALDEEYQWGFGSSPVVHDGLVILQCDLSKDSFLAAYRLEDGSLAWSTPRDDIPSWSSPVIWRNARRTEVVTNGSQYARGYDPATGRELWRLAKKSEITVPTPVPAGDLVFIVSGNRPIQPIFAVRPGAAGDISLKSGETKNASVAWGRMRGGPYMTTPIVYQGYLYTCSNAGMLSCYEAATGKEVYQERLGGVSYTASPVAADGRLYFTTEQGEVRVVKAGPEFELLAVNPLGDACLATPAISAGTFFARTQHHLIALGRQ
jgi:outer membrane protein assembly factor BamB